MIDTYTSGGVIPIQIAKDQPGFVKTDYVEDIVGRALLYLGAGFPVHLMSPAGTGKSTIAMYIAAQIGRPVILMHGDEELGTSDLVGGEKGYHSKKVVDNFIHSVLKSEEQIATTWVDKRLTVACKYGLTLIYDEFTRSRAEANNVLLSVLEEKVLDLPSAQGEEGFLKVHPDFRAIFTSNPEEYAGVHKAQDALRDRMITIKLSHYDRDTEIAITRAKSGVSQGEAEKIVNIVRDFRNGGKDGATPTVRAAVMIARILRLSGGKAIPADKNFFRFCMDILDSHSNGNGNGNGMHATGSSELKKIVGGLIKKHC